MLSVSLLPLPLPLALPCLCLQVTCTFTVNVVDASTGARLSAATANSMWTIGSSTTYSILNVKGSNTGVLTFTSNLFTLSSTIKSCSVSVSSLTRSGYVMSASTVTRPPAHTWP